MKLGKLLFGFFFVIFGIIFLLINLEIIVDFSLFSGIKSIWPIFLIIAGIFFVVKRKVWGSLFLVLAVLLGILSFVVSQVDFEEYETYFIKDYNGEEELYVSFDFGAANFYLNSSSENILFEMNSTSTFVKGYEYDLNYDNNFAYLDISEVSEFDIFNLFNTNGRGSNIDFYLNSNSSIDLNLNYGAVDAIIDLRDLNINKLNIDSGATSSEIYFGDLPIDVSIDTGASDFNLFFSDDIGIEIRVDGGIVDTNLEGFKKVGNKYYSDGFDSSRENIRIDIDAGATSINGEIIENE